MAKKITVAFELDAKDVKAMIQAKSKKTREISAEEIDRMAKEGRIRAADYLKKNELATVALVISKLKLVPDQAPTISAKVVKQFQSPQISKKIVTQNVKYHAGLQTAKIETRGRVQAGSRKIDVEW